ncbi:hypothetical protein [Prosthecodimorpha staleyi]|uniref:Uncharacterized protein n=1 Tax=Prosthecodimorpha staleyi TaxID=2840188 RepID=A0A947D779_9HYPH|nr:hypothetical protein [Prosthecodimorpha staleyi]MBT9288104.1 hypothetical protein [Prosthecodimorpha staleyi]
MPVDDDAWALLLEGHHGKVYLIANNPLITASDIRRLQIGPDDMIVQFNKTIHAERLASVAARKVFVYREKADTGIFFGFPPAGDVARDRGGGATIILAFNDAVASGRLSTEVLEALAGGGEAVAVAAVPWLESEWLDPSPFPDRPVTPTTGLLTLKGMQDFAARAGLSTTFVAVGFSGSHRPFWREHHIAHERAWLKRCGAVRINHSPWVAAVDRLRRASKSVRRVIRRPIRRLRRAASRGSAPNRPSQRP